MRYLLLTVMTACLFASCSPLHRIVIPQGELDSFFDYRTAPLPLVSAHRGGRFLDGYPENGLETFREVLRHTPALIECDVNLSRDSVLILLHDDGLDRTTTGRGPADAQAWKSLKKLRLVDDNRQETSQKIPSLKKTLKWARKKTILTLDIKDKVPLEKVVGLIEQTRCEDYAVVITYSLADAVRVHRLNPRLLISASIAGPEDLQAHLDAGIPADRLLAFTGLEAPDPDFCRELQQRGIPVLFGTFRTADVIRKDAARDQLYRTYLERGVHILATDRPIEAGAVLEPVQREVAEKQQYLRWPK